MTEKSYTGQDFRDKLIGAHREDVIRSWGEPDGKLSGFWGEYWYLDSDERNYVTLYYDINGNVEDIVTGTNKVNDDNLLKWDLIPMVMIGGKIYFDTGYESDVADRKEEFDVKIASEVDGSEKPNTDDQSNFGTGYGYQYGASDDTVEIFINGKWRIFATDVTRDEMHFSDE